MMTPDERHFDWTLRLLPIRVEVVIGAGREHGDYGLRLRLRESHNPVLRNEYRRLGGDPGRS